MLPCFKGQIAGICQERTSPPASVIGRAEESPLRWSPSELSDPQERRLPNASDVGQERLMRPRRQVLSLFMSLLGALISLWRHGPSCARCRSEVLAGPRCLRHSTLVLVLLVDL